MREMAREEQRDIEVQLEELDERLKVLLLPRDPNDGAKNVMLEIREDGTGGDEAAIWAGDLLKLYSKYAQEQGWSAKVVVVRLGGRAGLPRRHRRDRRRRRVLEATKFRGGRPHRVQRVPATETARARAHVDGDGGDHARGRRGGGRRDRHEGHRDARGALEGGAGGRRTSTRWRRRSVPDAQADEGIRLFVTQERSQLKNKELAFRLLRAKLFQMQEEERAAAIAVDAQDAGGPRARCSRRSARTTTRTRGAPATACRRASRSTACSPAGSGRSSSSASRLDQQERLKEMQEG